MVDQPIVTHRQRGLWGIALTAVIASLPAQSVDLDLRNFDAARTRLADYRLPADDDFYLQLTLDGHATGEATKGLISSANKDWLIAADVSGSWRWQAKAGNGHLTYAPTAKRQPLYDERPHSIGFGLSPQRREANLYFDGQHVATYSTNGTSLNFDQGLTLHDDLQGRGRSLRIRLGTSKPTSLVGDSPSTTPRELSVMAWNIWHGGRENGDRLGVEQVIDIIRRSGADIICMQETYGSGPQIADALGYYFLLRSSNLSIMSRYPIIESLDRYRPFNFGGATIQAGKLKLHVYSLWINHLPSLSAALAKPDCDAESLVAGEWKTRAKDMQLILNSVEPALENSDQEPVIIGGDFNSPSHLDWTAETADRDFHRGHVVQWPVSELCSEAGLIDGYRAVYADPKKSPGITWSPRFGETQRIDYVYHRGARLTPFAARVIKSHTSRFPSDHAAVLVQYRVTP